MAVEYVEPELGETRLRVRLPRGYGADGLNLTDNAGGGKDRLTHHPASGGFIL
jgi:hypothetical protein